MDGALHTLSLVFSPGGTIQGEPYYEPWPQQPGTTPPQRLSVDEMTYIVERDWRPGYPQSRLRRVGSGSGSGSGSTSPALFLRGKLGWPLGGALREVLLPPQHIQQSSQASGSHLLNTWPGPQ